MEILVMINLEMFGLEERCGDEVWEGERVWEIFWDGSMVKWKGVGLRFRIFKC